MLWNPRSISGGADTSAYPAGTKVSKSTAAIQPDVALILFRCTGSPLSPTHATGTDRSGSSETAEPTGQNPVIFSNWRVRRVIDHCHALGQRLTDCGASPHDK